VGEVKPLAGGPLAPREQTVLAAAGIARCKNIPLLAELAGVSEQQLEDTLAQLTRRGLITRGQPSRSNPRTARALRRVAQHPHNPHPPAA
jgi:predicted transcriptional regulator